MRVGLRRRENIKLFSDILEMLGIEICEEGAEEEEGWVSDDDLEGVLDEESEKEESDEEFNLVNMDYFHISLSLQQLWKIILYISSTTS